MKQNIEQRLHSEGIVIANIRKRSMAFFIDEMLLSFLLIIALGDSFFQAKTVQEMIILTNQFILEFIAMKIFYQAFFIMKYGATLGKIAMKIRVLEVDTLQTPNVIVSLNRSFIRIVSEMLFYLGYLWGMMDPNRQTWHDKSAKTLVVDV